MAKRTTDNSGDWRHQDPDDCDQFEKIRPNHDKAMPVSSRSKAKNASRKTEGSRKASKRIAQQIGGMNRRRSRRSE